jgi:hypothetical protein
MDFTGSERAQNGRRGAGGRVEQMSYESRAGQVERCLAGIGECTIYDLAKRVGMSRRGLHTICDRMAREGRIAVRDVPHRPNRNKHLISRK